MRDLDFPANPIIIKLLMCKYCEKFRVMRELILLTMVGTEGGIFLSVKTEEQAFLLRESRGFQGDGGLS